MLLGATNHYWRLDSALVRPGRLHQRIAVLPTATEDEVIARLRHFLGKDLLGTDLSRLGRVGLGVTLASTLQAVDAELRRSLDRSMSIIEENRDLVLLLTDRLIKERVLTENELAQVLGPNATTNGRTGGILPAVTQLEGRKTIAARPANPQSDF